MNKYCIERRESLNNLKHFLKIMRITLSFLFFCVLFSSASNSYSQEFIIKSRTASIKEVCKEIEKNSDYIFVFSDNSEEVLEKKVNIEAHSKNVREILDAALSETGLTYRILDKQIIVYKSMKATPSIPVEQPDINIIQQPAKKQINRYLWGCPGGTHYWRQYH
jgi:type II secretory pathway component GspD/PulD (secretin)